MLNAINGIIQNFKSNLFFVNDIRDIDTVGVLQKIKINTQFSFSYVILLASATIVCSLGLLLNSPPVVIGGMLISPLMWPLMKISVGVSYERKSFILQAVYLLIFSILISLLSSIVITLLSPLKTVTNEILARTTPTLLDIFVAIAAGGIAAFSIVQKKISDSLAGVAIATSLMPPLCVSGIGLALGDITIASGGFLLFFTNIISILFVSVFIFAFVGIKRKSDQPFRKKGIIFICLTLVVTSLPLLFLLKNYSFKSKAYQESKNIITSELSNISPELSVENISIESRSAQDDTIDVNADIISPDTVNLDYSQKAKIAALLEAQLGKKINLNLRIQKIISVKSEADIQSGQNKAKIREFIDTNLKKYSSSLVLGTIESSLVDGEWQILIVARIDPAINFTEKERLSLQDGLEKTLGQPVSLNINLLPLLALKNDNQEEGNRIKKDITDFISDNIQAITVTSISIKETNPSSEKNEELTKKRYDCFIHLEATKGDNTKKLTELRAYLIEKYKSDFVIEITTTLVERTSL